MEHKAINIHDNSPGLARAYFEKLNKTKYFNRHEKALIVNSYIDGRRSILDKPNKLYESQMKDFLGKYTREEISFGKLVELINEVTSPLSTEKEVNKDIDELFSEFRSQNPELSAAHFKEWLKLSYTISVSAIVKNFTYPKDKEKKEFTDDKDCTCSKDGICKSCLEHGQGLTDNN